MYPESSRKEIIKNKSRIFGKKTNTEPTPLITPSERNETNQEEAPISVRNVLKFLFNQSKKVPT